jgi:tRNA A37 threonylcarbamoyladenosine dehydratase
MASSRPWWSRIVCRQFFARAGVGSMTIVDGDVIDITNINRQLPALHSTVDNQSYLGQID